MHQRTKTIKQYDVTLVLHASNQRHSNREKNILYFIRAPKALASIDSTNEWPSNGISINNITDISISSYSNINICHRSIIIDLYIASTVSHVLRI